MKHCPVCETAYPNHQINCDADGELLVDYRELQPGTVIRNKYRIVKFLGRGGMGTVYLADHMLLDQQRALKFMASRFGDDPRALKRFRSEAQAAIQLRHPNVVEVLDLDQAEDGSQYIAMEYIIGRELEKELLTGAFPIRRALNLIRGIALGLQAAHAKGIVHRDIKPANIFIAGGDGKPEIPKVLDFGIAAMTELTSSSTQTTAVLLTACYGAPEQWRGMTSDELDGRADLYALGGVLYEMLTGQTCFQQRTFEGWMYDHVYTQPEAPSRLRAEIAQWPGLDQLVLRLLEKDRANRFADVQAFLLSLDAVKQVTRETVLEQPRKVNRSGTVEERIRGDRTTERPVNKAEASNRGSRKGLYAGAGIAIAAATAIAGFIFLNPHHTADSQLQAAAAQPVAALHQSASTRQNPRDGLNDVSIPAGTFLMGCSSGDTDCQENERPQHTVNLSDGFWMTQTPVTVAAWERYRSATGAAELPYSDQQNRTDWNAHGPADRPVVMATWQQATDYCVWAGMRLPSEAEWEYAARAGDDTPRYGELDSIAWTADNSGRAKVDAAALWNTSSHNVETYEHSLAANSNAAHSVGTKQPNAWGLYDMLGNVQEWVGDWYAAGYYRISPGTDPTGPPASDVGKVARGTSWGNMPAFARVSVRSGLQPDGRWNRVGFRCVGSLK